MVTPIQRGSRNRRSKTTNQPVNFEELGRTAQTDVFGSSFNDEIINNPKIDLDLLLNMLDLDGQASSLYRIITAPIIGTPLQVEQFDKRSTSERDFIDKVLHQPRHSGGMSTSITLVKSTIARVIIEGYSAHEEVFRFDESENKILLDKISYRPARTVRARVDDFSEFNGFVQRLMFNGRTIHAIIPKEKSLWFMMYPEFNHLYGKSAFNAGYYHYEKKHKLYYIAHIAAQLNATGLKIITPPNENPTKDESKAVMDAVAKIGFNSVIKMPYNWLLTLEKMGPPHDLMPLIQHHDQMMSKSILAQFMDLGVGSDSASFALGETHFNAFMEQINKLMTSIVDVLNTDLVPQLIDFNFISKKYPKIKYAPINKINVQLMREMFTRISSSKAVNASPQFMKEMEKRMAELLGLPVDYEDVDFPDMRTQAMDLQVEKGKEAKELSKENAKNQKTQPTATPRKKGE